MSLRPRVRLVILIVLAQIQSYIGDSHIILKIRFHPSTCVIFVPLWFESIVLFWILLFTGIPYATSGRFWFWFIIASNIGSLFIILTM